MLGRLRETAKKVDMFNTGQFLRYKDETEYGTLTGSCLSLGIIALILFLVYQVLINTIKKDEVTWSQSTEMEALPSEISLSVGDLKFGIHMLGVDLNDPDISYFDVLIRAYETEGGVLTSKQNIPVSACKEADWNTSEQVLNVYHDNKGQQWLCPKPDRKFSLAGRWTSDTSKTMSIMFYPCGVIYKGKTNCATEAQRLALFESKGGGMSTVIMMTNSLITPDSPDPVGHYVEDSYFVSLSPTAKQSINVYVSEYEIETDVSLLPMASVQTQRGPILSRMGNYAFKPRTSNTSAFSTIKILKSAQKVEYERSYHKLDETISYAGGLIGVIVGLFFIMSPYTELCFEISLANRLFKDDAGRPVRQSFNFFNYLLYWTHYALNCCCCMVSWEQYDLYAKCSDRVQKELDISYLLKRICTLERVISSDHSLNKQLEKGFERIKFGESQSKLERICFEQDPPDSAVKSEEAGKGQEFVANNCSVMELKGVQNHSFSSNVDIDLEGNDLQAVVVRAQGPLIESNHLSRSGIHRQSRESLKRKRRPQSSLKAEHYPTENPIREVDPFTYEIDE